MREKLKIALPDRWLELAQLGLRALMPIWAACQRIGLTPLPSLRDGPHLAPQAAGQWRSALKGSGVYLEYGSGGSTLEALRTVPVVVSVENDWRYIAALERRTATEKPAGTLHILHADIGMTSDYGFPVFTHPTARRRSRWTYYPYAPWRVLTELGLPPDVIFVDGRFRVASVLVSLINLPEQSKCQILLDDFASRKDMYGAVLEFAEDVAMFDEMIVFRKAAVFDQARALQVLKQYELDFR